MNPDIKSETNYNGNVIPQTEWIEASYHHNLQDGPKKEPKQMPNLKRQPIKKKPHRHPKDIAAEQKLKEANKKDLNERNLK